MSLSINDSDTLAEVTAVFQRYEAALLRHDPQELDAMFLPSLHTVRYGVAEIQYGIDEVRQFRVTQSAFERSLSRTVITTFGQNMAVASTLFHRPDFPSLVGRQTQTWVRTDAGWQIAAAHVSMINVS